MLEHEARNNNKALLAIKKDWIRNKQRNSNASRPETSKLSQNTALVQIRLSTDQAIHQNFFLFTKITDLSEWVSNQEIVQYSILIELDDDDDDDDEDSSQRYVIGNISSTIKSAIGSAGGALD
ncbi:unnamed protein product [Rhizophagus irregularis]|uniref:Uncharacterized protein n=1 Tax=Rhizophagus irregularis TaxID=588596 RepID=A0A915ZYL5_9GLOM|nr:unnamed protein product [Rhizophagus irregularis]CAB5392112.1 unnamed protein product [Rhizophagus irregularis]